MGDRIETTWGELGELFDGPHATPIRRSEGPYFLNISSLKSGRLDLAESDHVSPDDFQRWTRRVTPREGDLLFSYETRLGEAALMPGSVEACLGRRMALLRPDVARVHPRFLLYYFLSPGFQQLIETHMIHGATVPRIGLASMPNWSVSIPRLGAQRAIAEVLGALDDKIAANDRVAAVAAEMGAAIFEKVSRQSTNVVPLADLVSTQYGLTASAKDTSGPRFLRVMDINKRPWIEWGEVPGCDLTDVELAKYRLVPGDLVVARMADPGKAAIFDQDDPESVFASYLVRLAPHDRAMSKYLYYFLTSPRYRRYAEMVTTGSVQKNMNARVIVGCEIPLPEADALAEFDAAVSPVRRHLSAVLAENRRLAKTRDELLPLLMSGKVRVTKEAADRSADG